MVYQTDVSFPSDYIIPLVPAECTASTATDFECNTSGSAMFSAVFPNITTVGTSSGVTPIISYVGIDGETCTQQTTCPRLLPSNGSGSISPTGPTSSGGIAPPTQTRPPTNNPNLGNNIKPVDSKKVTIIAVSVAVAVVVLIALCIVLRRNMTSVSSTGLTRKNSMHQRMARRSGDNVPAGGPGSFGGPDGYALYRQRTLNRARSVRDLQEKAAAAAAAAAMRSKEGFGSGIGGSTAGLTTSFGSTSEVSVYSSGGGADSRAEMGLARHPSTRTYSSLRTARSKASQSNAQSPNNSEHELAHVNVFEDSRYMTDDHRIPEEKHEADAIQLEPTSPTESTTRDGPPMITSPLSKKPSMSRKASQNNGHFDDSEHPVPDRAHKNRPSELQIGTKTVGFVDMDREEMKADRSQSVSPTLHRSMSQTRSPTRSLGMGLSSPSMASAAEEEANLKTVEATKGLQRSLSTKERRELDQHRAHASRHIMRSHPDE
ncbi:hypothetical protein BGZ73_000056 [Actinomortierella ambigua]|nr:hypothetical protein BGZ73_000056 [Actinomortierella ambigua]